MARRESATAAIFAAVDPGAPVPGGAPRHRALRGPRRLTRDLAGAFSCTKKRNPR